jgi:ABC-type spermidine/putrescine transport system permease subunit I
VYRFRHLRGIATIAALSRVLYQGGSSTGPGRSTQPHAARDILKDGGDERRGRARRSGHRSGGDRPPIGGGYRQRASGDATSQRSLPLRHAAGTALLLLPALVFLAVVFLAPLARLLTLSLSASGGPFATFQAILGDEIYRRVFANTFGIATIVTVVTTGIGYPIALALTRLPPGWRAGLFACVLLPLWISVLVRTFAWMLLLERNGPVNRFLLGSGLTDQPLPLLFNQGGVLIRMVHVLMPYAVIPIYAALIRIEPDLLMASEGLGASRFTTFRRVLLPLSLRGVATAATFVFLLSLGFFITPALLGGSASITLSILIESLVNDRLDWPLAAAASFVLLGASLLVLAVAARLVPIRMLAEVGR